jgi:hypothetical protein
MGTKSKKKQGQLAELSPTEVRHLLRPREGFVPYAAQMLALYEAHPEELSVKGLDVASLREDLAALDALAPQLTAAERTTEQLRQTLLQRGSNVYRAMLQIYRRAKSAAETDEVMEHGIAGTADFLRPRKSRAKKVATPTTPTAPPTTPTP